MNKNFCRILLWFFLSFFSNCRFLLFSLYLWIFWIRMTFFFLFHNCKISTKNNNWFIFIRKKRKQGMWFSTNNIISNTKCYLLKCLHFFIFCLFLFHSFQNKIPFPKIHFICFVSVFVSIWQFVYLVFVASTIFRLS